MRSLEARRAALLARSGVQREWLVARLAPAARTLAAADRLAATTRAHPVITAAAIAGLLLARPQTLLRWLLRAAPLYPLLRRLVG